MESYPGAAVLVDSMGRTLAANQPGAGLAVTLGAGLDFSLRAAVSSALSEGAAASLDVQASDQDGNPAVLHVSLVPLLAPDGTARVLVLGRETTVERGIIQALVESRRLFKDLVMCSSDFAWETNEEGAFGFVSPRGALGYTVGELNGRLAYQMLDRMQGEPEIFPFDSRVRLEDAEVHMLGADGSTVCLLVSCVPVFAETGEYRGSRGVCRDVTETRNRDAELARVRGREDLLGSIVESIRSEVTPSAMLGAAAEATAQALRARHCWILRGGVDGFSIAADDGGDAGPPPEEAQQEAILHLQRTTGGTAIRVATNDLVIIAAGARYQDRVNGGIAVAREISGDPFDDDDASLVADVADRLGIAMEQIANTELLERLSRTDELTGLLNRRAFTEEVARRLEHHRRTGRPGAILYLDLDNFKLVNDLHGHQRGDEAIRTVASMLQSGSRIGDLAARLGGDEFGLWLEDASLAAAIAKAQAILDESDRLRSHSADADHPLGLSIGISISAPDEDMSRLLARADHAMYQVKRAGKGGFAVAPLPAAGPGSKD